MASTVFKVEEVELIDGSTVTVKPLSIKDLRVGMDLISFEGMEDSSEEEFLDLLIKAAAFCVRKSRNDLWDAEKNTYSELAEDVFDTDTVLHIIKETLGVDFKDPKIQEMAEKLAAEMEKEAEPAGKTSTSQNSKQKPS